ncbi:HAD family hydrolase [Desulfonema ishimotonii]|uniref:phosphoglycolate phosphatase n=1 Tax=Desulfonema ishimotonii TaxID=45657 RepID=A0A401FTZ3_9BACT|nr:HAD family hydrolase [Desulfonema ishimotonii]GBC60439.1 HAD family hydrolase [Desulfonema ishimotonii]
MDNIKTIIFDFDGTLADTERAIKETFRETVNELEMQLPASAADHPDTCRTLEEMFEAVGVSDKAQRAEALARYHARYAINGPEKADLFPGVRATLQTLLEWGFRLAIATNERRENLEMMLPALGLEHFFDTTVCENEVSDAKPSPEMACRIMRRMDVWPSQTLMVGDSVPDMEMGKSAGCLTCGVTYGVHSRERLRAMSPNRMISRFTSLLAILNAPCPISPRYPRQSLRSKPVARMRNARS